MSRISLILCVVILCARGGPLPAADEPDQRTLDTKMAKERASKFDPKKLQKVDVDAVVKNGLGREKADIAPLLKRCDEGIKTIQATKAYNEGGVKLLIWPWEKVKECLLCIQQGKPLPEIELDCQAQRDGAMYSGGTHTFKGDAKRACELMREIGLKDTTNGKSWSEMWGHMERTVTPLGKREDDDPVVAVNCILGVNQWGFIYKQVYNVRTIEYYSEYDLGNGCYLILQNLICDGSEGQRPRGSARKKRLPKKEYYPVVEQISMTVIRDNKDGTFTLGNFMSTKAQPLKVVSNPLVKLMARFVDLMETTKKDTIKNREKWNELFQKEVLRPVEK